MKLFESGEDYLERILMLQKENGTVKAIDIANSLNYSKASVSIAMKKLKESGYIVIDDYGYIFLTNQGKLIAKNILDRHEIISSILIDLGVHEKQALNDACKIEHGLSNESFEAIRKYFKK